jgi:hypothetical protein
MGSSDTRTAHWQLHITAWQSSAQSQATYCREHGLVKSQFSYWKRKLMSKEAAPRQSQGTGFIAVQRLEAQSSGLTVRFPNGVTLVGIHATDIQFIQELSRVWL